MRRGSSFFGAGVAGRFQGSTAAPSDACTTANSISILSARWRAFVARCTATYVASSRARENSATFAPICQAAQRTSPSCRSNCARGLQLKRSLSYQKYRAAIMLMALWPWPWPWSKTVITIANMPNCTARPMDKPLPLSLCIVICFRLPETLSLAVLLADCFWQRIP
jgi:hypothetical protein